MRKVFQRVVWAACALGIGVLMLNGCDDSGDWKKGAQLLETRGLDPSLLPNSPPRNFYYTHRDPESSSHVSEQVAILRQAEAGAKILVEKGFEKKKIPYLNVSQLREVWRARQSGDKRAMEKAVSDCERAL